MLGLATNPIPIKAAMKLLGRDTGELRLPMTPLDAASEARLRKTLTNYGLARRPLSREGTEARRIDATAHRWPGRRQGPTFGAETPDFSGQIAA